MTISLVIPAYNEESCIGECLKYALRNSRGLLSQIIVVDSGSTDKTREIASQYPGVEIVRDEKKGPNHARQLGLNRATGELVAFIDADTHLTPEWLLTASDFFKTHPKAVSLSGPYRYYDGSTFLRFLLCLCWWTSAPIAYRIAGYALLGGNFIAKKSALIAMGGFDTNIAFYGDDTDTARRLHAFGDVVFKMDFYILSSCRRYSVEGILTTNWHYAMNFIWQILFKRPFTKKYTDIRK